MHQCSKGLYFWRVFFLPLGKTVSRIGFPNVSASQCDSLTQKPESWKHLQRRRTRTKIHFHLQRCSYETWSIEGDFVRILKGGFHADKTWISSRAEMWAEEKWRKVSGFLYKRACREVTWNPAWFRLFGSPWGVLRVFQVDQESLEVFVALCVQVQSEWYPSQHGEKPSNKNLQQETSWSHQTERFWNRSAVFPPSSCKKSINTEM